MSDELSLASFAFSAESLEFGNIPTVDGGMVADAEKLDRCSATIAVTESLIAGTTIDHVYATPEATIVNGHDDKCNLILYLSNGSFLLIHGDGWKVTIGKPVLVKVGDGA